MRTPETFFKIKYFHILRTYTVQAVFGLHLKKPAAKTSPWKKQTKAGRPKKVSANTLKTSYFLEGEENDFQEHLNRRKQSRKSEKLVFGV